ncbi:peptidoglycan hydrolase CwlO-like protein [Alkalibacillus filiformis]|uniref:Peptidoglycan hydrolase CwlO-like protein n=1 Tax=Alkalibacillus filiformis TaxID=200990 RepID=A0ABU0DRV3_9BACI|nr:C40 family peptidase [Alkalibacillus filiformis]MDQ0351183.1 peptidoglycan hydrolase CwlO-like protein [Alkalibacillus filiformis]
MNKIIYSIALTLLVTLAFTATTYAETDELRDRESEISDERSQLSEELSEAESELAEVLTELEELNQEIDRINEAREQNEAKLEETEQQIDETQEEADYLEEEIETIQERIDIRQEVLNERLSTLQRNGGNVNYIDVILGASNFGEFVSRVTTVNKIMDSDKDLVDQQVADKNEVEDKQQTLLDRLNELESMEEELVGMNELLEDQKDSSEQKQDELQDKQQELVALQEELEVQDRELASLQEEVRQDIEREEAESVTLASSNSSSNDSSSSSGDVSNTVQSSSSSPSNVSGNGSMESVIAAGMTQTGTPYVWGGTSTSGFDCSGFLTWAFSQGGLNVQGRTTDDFVHVGTRVSASEVQRGDLVFFDTYKQNGHIGIYLGNGQFLGAQNSTGVAVANMTSGYWNQKFNGHVRRIQ